MQLLNIWYQTSLHETTAPLLYILLSCYIILSNNAENFVGLLLLGNAAFHLVTLCCKWESENEEGSRQLQLNVNSLFAPFFHLKNNSSVSVGSSYIWTFLYTMSILFFFALSIHLYNWCAYKPNCQWQIHRWRGHSLLTCSSDTAAVIYTGWVLEVTQQETVLWWCWTVKSSGKLPAPPHPIKKAPRLCGDEITDRASKHFHWKI